MLDAGIYDMQQFKEGGWLTDLKYEDEINDMLKPKTGEMERSVVLCFLRKVSMQSANLSCNASLTCQLARQGGVICCIQGATAAIRPPSYGNDR
jgi:hypothetical protein